MYIVFFIISVAASMIGAICGIGGGIIIKPALDSFGLVDVASINFLSGCTVLSMTLYSVGYSKITKDTCINYRVSTSLAIGAIIGGITGKVIFQAVCDFGLNTAGLIQAICLIIVTVATLIFTVRIKKTRTMQVDNLLLSAVLGLVLGLMSSFLGIGGGPVNLVVLIFFYSMDLKAAAENSLYIILFSQAANLTSSIITGTVPCVNGLLLVLMICEGIVGGIIGKKLNKKLRSSTINRLFIYLMLFIILINAYNVVRFSLII